MSRWPPALTSSRSDWRTDVESSATTRVVLLLVCGIVATAGVASAQATGPSASPDGAGTFQRACATCHGNQTASAGPSVDVLRQLAPEAIVTALTTGRMRIQGDTLSVAERRAVAEFLGGRPLAGASSTEPNRCTTTAPLPSQLAGPAWNGWSPQPQNTRYQAPASAGLIQADVPKLTLKWAFGFAGSLAARTQPTVVAGRIFTASERGDVYALDARTGCTHWTYSADAAVRTAMTVVPYRRDGSTTRYAVYFGDGRANAYALDADTGQLLWKQKLDDHPNAGITGAPALFDGRVYLATSAAGEEVRGGRPDYGCCTFRGSVSALDAVTGRVIWKSFSIASEPKPRAINSMGVQLFGPAGGGIWGAPTIDARRGVLYVGTGNGFSEPLQRTTNAILAFELSTGRLRWSHQTIANDIWLWQCPAETAPNQNCPPTQGPDFDFGTSPLIARTPGGRELLVVPQKSGVLYAFDPDRDGAIVWQYRFGDGSALGGQWGAAADERHAYVGVGGSLSASPGGVHAVDLETGRRVWYSPPQPRLCRGGADDRCFAAQGGALTAIAGVVFSGGADGGLRAYDTRNGALLWQVDTNRDFDTVNGVKANGATIDGAGPVVVDGMVFVNSGYNGIVGRSGNVLLAFGVN
jgi:polyvinyl alcohol dehydrogenase (cytochrome)